MAHFCKVENGVVTDLIVVSNDDCGGGNFPESEVLGRAFISMLALNDSRLEGDWYQTSYNSIGGVHYGPDGEPDGGFAFRHTFGEIGSHFDPDAGEHGEFHLPNDFFGDDVFPRNAVPELEQIANEE